MQSRNPVFANNSEFNGRAAVQTDPSRWQIDLDGSNNPTHTGTGTGRMTLENVVEKTAVTLGVLVVAAAVAWISIGQILDESGFSVNEDAVQRAYMITFGGAIVGLVLSLVNSFKKVVSPPLVIGYAIAEGAFVGGFSKLVASFVGDTSIVAQAVVGTMVAFGGTLAAYKFFNIQVTDKFRRIVTISMFAFVGTMLINFVLSMTGVINNGGLRGFNTLGLVVSAIAVVLAVFMLIMDFDYVERGVAAGIPEREAWRAAFGLTVTLVWLYIEILRILMILRGND